MSVPSMLYGAALSAVLALAAALVIMRERQRVVLITVAAVAFAMPLSWNAILRVTHASAQFSHDLPFPVFPISWQDTGSGVFTLAGGALALCFGVYARRPASTAVRLAAVTALAALLIDIYTY